MSPELETVLSSKANINAQKTQCICVNYGEPPCTHPGTQRPIQIYVIRTHVLVTLLSKRFGGSLPATLQYSRRD